MPRFFTASIIALAIAGTPAMAKDKGKEPQPAPLSALVKSVSIPYQQFTLPNGLQVLVHTDRKAPVVAVSVWYGVGSKHEPKGKTGFAHLFEHLMFNGSENSPGDFFKPLQEVGATDFNGTTWFDRTNYFETVPTGALDRALMLESDRMGYLLGAVTQEKLTNQIGVVQNEKRQGDNQPFGLVEYEQYENLYPSGHPYHHSTIGSMADLSSASLEDVKQWFRDNYGPNNAILVLAGDIDLPTAKAKVTKWFGAIPAGPKIKPVNVPVPDLPAPLAKTIKDQVATTRIYRMWAIPGLDNPEYLALEAGGSVLGGLASSRLDDALVRQQKVAVSVTADAQIFAQGGQFVIYADVKPGEDPAKVGAALDAEVAKFLREGPTPDELRRASTTYAANEIRGLESVGGFSGKAPTLAEGLLYNGTPDHYRIALDRMAKLTPAAVRTAMQKWLSRPVFSLTVEPGTRTEGGENRGGYIVSPDGLGARPAFFRDPLFPVAGASGAAAATQADRSKLPEVGELTPLDFPTIERAKLSNGMQVYFTRRAAVPVVSVRVSFDAGFAADPKSALGTQALLLRLMNEGTEKLDSTELARARERLGANIRGFADTDTTSFQLDTVTPNLAPSLKLFSDFIRRPALAPAELERVRVQQLAAIRAELKNPGPIASRVLQPLLYGKDHPYGIAPSGTGDPAVVEKLTREQLKDFHDQWFRPETAKVFVSGNTSLAEVTKLLEASFADWKGPAGPAPTKNFNVPIPVQSERIVLVDRPASPQSLILAGKVLPVKGTDDLLTLRSANDILGGNFLSRINMNLRETKGWSYGAGSGVGNTQDRVTFRVQAPVQADRTGDSIAEIRKELTSFLTTNGVSAEELGWSTTGSARELPGSFETSGDVLGGLVSIVNFKRPDTWYETLADRYKTMTAAELDAKAREMKLGEGLVYVVVGDAKVVEPQLKQLGLPVEVIPAAK
ncbi:MAG: M16 family metallopeptidase [Pseudomonadota bacterium]